MEKIMNDFKRAALLGCCELYQKNLEKRPLILEKLNFLKTEEDVARYLKIGIVLDEGSDRKFFNPYAVRYIMIKKVGSNYETISKGGKTIFEYNEVEKKLMDLPIELIEKIGSMSLEYTKLASVNKKMNDIFIDKKFKQIVVKYNFEITNGHRIKNMSINCNLYPLITIDFNRFPNLEQLYLTGNDSLIGEIPKLMKLQKLSINIENDDAHDKQILYNRIESTLKFMSIKDLTIISKFYSSFNLSNLNKLNLEKFSIRNIESNANINLQNTNGKQIKELYIDIFFLNENIKYSTINFISIVMEEDLTYLLKKLSNFNPKVLELIYNNSDTSYLDATSINDLNLDKLIIVDYFKVDFGGKIRVKTIETYDVEEEEVRKNIIADNYIIH
jgi:hypothetical protein